MIDRTKAPKIKSIEKIKLHEPEMYQLSNGVPVYVFNGSKTDTLEFELYFNAGSWFENKRLVSSFTSRMLIEGTERKTNKQLMQAFSYYGINFFVNSSDDTASIGFGCLTKHFSKAMKLLTEVLFESNFPQKELELIQKQKVQNYKLQLKETEYLATKTFDQAIYGDKHPYGYFQTEKDYLQIDRDDLVEFHNTKYLLNGSTIFIAGSLPKDFLKIVEKDLWIELKPVSTKIPEYKASEPSEKEIFVNKADAVQNTICLGRRIIGKAHKDYQNLFVLNFLFGGSYFNARLMQNIREDKGYTYGIYSKLENYLHGADFLVQADVNAENTHKAIHEVFSEMNLLREKLVSPKELKMLRFYLQSVILNWFDGVFAQMSSFKNIYFYGLGYEYYKSLIERVQNITAEELRKTAIDYFHEEKMIRVIAGKRN